MFLIGVIFGPLLETAIFQFLPIETYFKFSKSQSVNKKWATIIASSIIFGVTHNYNILTMIDAFIAGIIFATIYFYFKEEGMSGFFFTFLIHSMFNTYAFILDHLLKLKLYSSLF